MHLKWGPNCSIRIHLCLMALLQVSNVLASRHLNSGSVPFKTSFVLPGDYATRRSAALVSLPSLANQPDGLLMDEEDLESASDELTTRELDYLQKNLQPVASTLERRNAAESSARVSAEFSELATIELEDPMTSSPAESASTSVTIPVIATGAPLTTTTSLPSSTTSTTTTTTTTSAPEKESNEKPELTRVTMKSIQMEVADLKNISSTTIDYSTSTLQPKLKIEVPVTTSTTARQSLVNVTEVITTASPIVQTTTTNYGFSSTPVTNVGEKNVTYTETIPTAQTTKSVPTTTTIKPPPVTEVERNGRMCRAGPGCSFQVAEVPVLETQLDFNRAHDNKTRVVNEFVIVPNDSPLTFEDSAYPARLSNDTELKAEHRNVDGDDVEVDYINSEADTTTKIDVEMAKSVSFTPSTGAPSTTTSTTAPTSTSTTTTTTAPPISTTSAPTTTTMRPSSSSVTTPTRLIQQQVSTTLSPPTTRQPVQTVRLNQKFLRITDSPTSTTRPTSSVPPIKSVSRYSSSRMSGTRASGHRLYFSEPESEPRRRHKYASIAADEEEMKILTRYPIISQLSRLSGSTRSSGLSSQRTVTQSPVVQLLTKKQAIAHNHQPLVDSETSSRRQASAKISQPTTRSSTTTTTSTTPTLTSNISTLRTTLKVASTTTTAKPTTTTTTVKPTSTSTASPTTVTVASTTSAARPESTSSPATRLEERLTLIAISGSENHLNKTAPVPAPQVIIAERKKNTQMAVARTSTVGGQVRLKGDELSGEFELGSVEDQLAKDALHQRKWVPDESRRSRTNKYTNRQKSTNHQQQVDALDSGLWHPSAADELSSLSSMADETGGSTGDLLPGKPGIDYPVHADIPRTSFDCRNHQQSGFYADVESGCQAYHSCHKGRGGRHTFMCPNGTLFSQELLTCDWWYNVECSSSKLYFGGEGAYHADTDLGLDALA